MIDTKSGRRNPNEGISALVASLMSRNGAVDSRRAAREGVGVPFKLAASGPPAVVAYPAAVLAVGITAVLALVISSGTNASTTPLTLLVFAVAFSAWYGGLRPGLFAAALTIAAGVILVEPQYGLEIAFGDWIRVGVLGGVGTLVAVFMSGVREGQRDAGILADSRQQLLEAVTASERRYSTLAGVARDLTRLVPDRDAQLDYLVARLTEVGGDAAAALVPRDDGTLEAVAVAYHSPEVVAGDSGPGHLSRMDEGLHAQVFQTGETLFIRTIDEALRERVRQDFHPHFDRYEAGSVIVAPLKSEGRVVGELAVIRSRDEQPYSEDDVDLVNEIADRASIGLHVAMLYERQREIAEENSRLYQEATQLAEQLRESNALKDQFLGLVSHELRTPITTIMGNLRLFRDRAEQLNQDTKRQMIEDASWETERLHSIIENLLLLTRLESGHDIEPEPTLIARVLREQAGNFQRRNPRRPVVLSIDLEDVLVEADRTYLELVLENLLSNADKYSPEGTDAHIVLRQNGDEARVSVLDRGIGISEEAAAHLFTPFYRTSQAKLKAKGMGVGLAVCRRIVEAHGGRVWARPRPDGGSEFGFALPIVNETDEWGGDD